MVVLAVISTYLSTCLMSEYPFQTRRPFLRNIGIRRRFSVFRGFKSIWPIETKSLFVCQDFPLLSAFVITISLNKYLTAFPSVRAEAKKAFLIDIIKTICRKLIKYFPKGCSEKYILHLFLSAIALVRLYGETIAPVRIVTWKYVACRAIQFPFLWAISLPS